MGWLLGIDTATRRGNLALGRLSDSGTLLPDIHLRCYEGGQDHAERLLGELDALMSTAGLSLADVEAIAVGIGPGSFTGVRVGVTTAKALSFVSGARLVAVGSLEAMARGWSGPAGLRLPVLDARRDELFVGAFDEAGVELRPAAHLPRRELLDWLRALGPAGAAVLLGEMALEETAPLGFTPERSADSDLPGARALLEVGAERLRAGAVVDGPSLQPAYLRPPDAALPATSLPPAREPRLDSAPHGRPGRNRTRPSAGAFWA